MSTMVHVIYGFYIFSTALAGDLSQALNEFFCKPSVDPEVKEEMPQGEANNVHHLPPIVLVHGIFGFGKGVSPYVLCIIIHKFTYSIS